MKILALDPSTTAVGWCWAIGPDYLKSGVYVPAGDDAWQRVESVEGWLIDRCVEWMPGILAYEVPAGDHRNRDVNRKMGSLEYVIRKIARLCDIAIVSVYPAQVKATGCSKDNPYPGTAMAGHTVSGDEADAIGVYLWAWGQVKEQKLLERAR